MSGQIPMSSSGGYGSNYQQHQLYQPVQNAYSAPLTAEPGYGYQTNYNANPNPTYLNAAPQSGEYATLHDAPQPQRNGYTQASQYPDSGAAAAPAHAPAHPAPAPAKKKGGNKKWWILAIILIILICIILAAVLGGVLGSRANKDNSNSDSRSGVGLGDDAPSVKSNYSSSLLQQASDAAKRGNVDDITYEGTDVYGNPVLKSGSASAKPTSGGNPAVQCKDNWSASNSLDTLRDHPRLIAPQYQWDCLADRINHDAYLTIWNSTIFNNATEWLNAKPANYSVDGDFTLSGILDVSRIVQQRVKAWAYAYRVSKDKKWVDRTYKELSVAAGNTSTPFGNGKGGTGNNHWNPDHFLDTAEMMSAFAFAYDWMYDAWDDGQKANIIDWIVRYGLQPGLDAYNQNTAWWSQTASGNGNWNCVCNGGLVFAALAIKGDAQGDNANVVNQILPKALDNAKQNCMRAVYNDGTWSETPNYWYFGTNGQARMLSALETATGSDQGLMDQNKNWYKTADFHMYVSGNGGLFAYGDNGPNKFSTTANQMFLYAQKANEPRYALFQRDRADAAADPLSMFWYDTTSKGAYYNGLALDQWFNNSRGNWMSMRSSWTDTTGTYVAMKASNLTGHQTHGDLDAGDFVIDALGVRFIGEYGSDNYLSKDYFSSEASDSARWQYFRKSTQGQNTIILGNQNQNPNCLPQNKFESSGTVQNNRVSFTPGANDTAYFITDMSSCYSQDPNVVRRGIRFLNGRRQVLLQDEIKKNHGSVEWRVHTNGTVTLSSDKRTATLKISNVRFPNAAGADPNGDSLKNIKLQTAVSLKAQILSPSNATFETNKSPNQSYQLNPPSQDNDIFGNKIQAEVADDGVTILSIKLDGNNDENIQVWFQPVYTKEQDGDKTTPKSVALDNWSLTSH
ncbi:hypothetical protein MCUN1_002838 [Malassezia cuniculi]|uniref:Heparinase II/III-like C-terminal domain-containing protein n=1 Tax=Malassezia cuniculi TaxID=948313 RepID=A0AAF0J6V5_9BASI|nr:hypothetical protein MCUN1_002838 [Malassezia cuniculi]